MVKAITLAGFEKTFSASDDPWRTFSDRDEALKRGALLHALGPAPLGRVLELAAGNGSNSVALARRSLRLDATEGTAKGTSLVRSALDGRPRARAVELVLPAPFPRSCYDAALVAEVLYYLSPHDMARVARDIAAVLRAGGRLVLAHHRIDFHDFAQHAEGIHRRFLRSTGRKWVAGPIFRTGRWLVEGFTAR